MTRAARREEKRPRRESVRLADRKLDPILAEILRFELLAISEEMLITMKRATRSILAREGADYGTAILDARGEIVAQALPYGFIFFISAVGATLEKFGDTLRDGDVIVTNDPYGGVSHLPDIVVIKPIFWEDDLVSFVAVAEHHTDVGGRFPGGNGVLSASVFEEGLRLPAVKLYESGRQTSGVREIIEANVRAPDDVIGDLDASVAACLRGEEMMNALYQKHTPAVVSFYGAHLVADSEMRMREILNKIPTGTYRASSVFDSGLGVTVELDVAMDVASEGVTLDYSRCSDQMENALNLPPDHALAKAPLPLLGLFSGTDTLVLNSGLVRPFKIVATKGSFVNPYFPAAVGARSQLSHHLMHLQAECLAQALPDVIPAAGDGFTGAIYFSPKATFGNAGGVHTEFFVSGWGARPDRDGVDGVMPMMISGFRTLSGEIMELDGVIALDGFGFVCDSGGVGRFRGTLSVFRRWRFLCDGRLMVRDLLPSGVHEGRAGGGSGAPSFASLTRNGLATPLPRQTLIDVQVVAGDILYYQLPGGGGFGDAHRRDPAAVLADVLDEKVSPARAEAAYGVAISVEEASVDVDKTRELRRHHVSA